VDKKAMDRPGSRSSRRAEAEKQRKLQEKKEVAEDREGKEISQMRRNGKMLSVSN
jgi:hypothetical protein